MKKYEDDYLITARGANTHTPVTYSSDDEEEDDDCDSYEEYVDLTSKMPEIFELRQRARRNDAFSARDKFMSLEHIQKNWFSRLLFCSISESPAGKKSRGDFNAKKPS